MLTTYIVETGNWKCRVRLDESDQDFAYIEAATRAIEGVFGNRELTQDCEMFSLLNQKGEDYFNPDVKGNVPIPPPMFSIVTAVYKEKDLKAKKKGKAFVYLSSLLFENASQPINIELAKIAERQEPEKVKKFIDLQKKKKKD